MGGLFSAPKVVTAAASDAATTTTTTNTEAAAEGAAAMARAEARERARHGLAGTIATSARGVLEASPALAGARKTLLGE